MLDSVIAPVAEFVTRPDFSIHLTEAVNFFIYAFMELAVLFVGISFLVGVINEFVPPERVRAILSGRQGRGYLAAAGLGTITPFCSCSTIPMTVGLLRARAGFGPTMTFLFISPLMNMIILGLIFSLFGLRTTLIYATMATSLAVTVGWLLNRFRFQRFIKFDLFETAAEPACGCDSAPARVEPIQPTPATCCANGAQLPMDTSCCGPSSGPTSTAVAAKPSRWRRIFMDSLNQFIKLMPLIALGLVVGAILHGFVPADIIGEAAGADNPLAVPVSAFIGVPLYVRASTILPIGLSLIGKGMSIGAVFALVIGGAGASLPEVIMLKGLFRWPILFAFLISVFGMAIVTGYTMNWVL